MGMENRLDFVGELRVGGYGNRKNQVRKRVGGESTGRDYRIWKAFGGFKASSRGTEILPQPQSLQPTTCPACKMSWNNNGSELAGVTN